MQARAAVEQQKANLALSHSNLGRYTELSARKLVAPSDLDERKAQAAADTANLAAAEANVVAQQANIRRLTDVQSFARVAAPFAGTVTARMVDRGALVSIGNTTPLFKISATDPLRVFVQVPQEVAPSVRIGVDAQVIIREYAGRSFAGTVSRAAGELDPSLRTMNTEIRIPNPSGEILPGMYAQVALTLPSPHRVCEVPATAIYNDARGVRVAVVDSSGKIAFVPVTIERDTGTAIQISTGLEGNERVVKLGSASLTEGTRVEAIEQK